MKLVMLYEMFYDLWKWYLFWCHIDTMLIDICMRP